MDVYVRNRSAAAAGVAVVEEKVSGGEKLENRIVIVPLPLLLTRLKYPMFF